MVTVGQQVYNSLILLAYHYFSASVPRSLDVHPDEGLGIRAQITKHGYSFEEHEVQTDDGYLLTLFRLSSPQQINKEGPSPRGAPVLLVHGIMSSAQDFVLMGPNISMTYGLVNSGYDVWLGNSRGNTWGRKHIKYSPDSARFWKFSFHEMGYYDLPAKLDHITNITGYESVYYVGHSQGCTSMFIMASERPEYIKKVRLFTALAPVVYPKAMPALLAALGALLYRQLEWIAYTFEYIELFPHSKIQSDTLRLISRSGSPYAELLRAFVSANLGYSNDTDPALFPLIVSNFPAGSATRQLLHFLQNKISDSFRKYDYGPMMNLKVYGQWQPPKYNVRTRMPTALIYSVNDWLSTEDDVNRVSTELKNLILKYKLPKPYSHIDYLYGRETNQILLDVLQKLFKEH